MEGRRAVSDEPQAYDYRLTVVIDGEQGIFTGIVETREFWINGQGCEPKTANAHIEVAADGSVEVTHFG